MQKVQVLSQPTRDADPRAVGGLAAGGQRAGEDLERLEQLDLGLLLDAGALEQDGQRADVVGAEDDVHPRGPGRDEALVLLRQAAADGDLHPRGRVLDRLEVAEVAVQAVVGVLADGAGVEDDDVRGAAGAGGDVAVGVQQPGDPLAVVHVHLAPVGAHLVRPAHASRLGGAGAGTCRPLRGVLPKHRTGQYGRSHDLLRAVARPRVKETSDRSTVRGEPCPCPPPISPGPCSPRRPRSRPSRTPALWAGTIGAVLAAARPRLHRHPQAARGLHEGGRRLVGVLHRAAARLRRLHLVPLRLADRRGVPHRLPGREVPVGRQPVRLHAAADRLRRAGCPAAAGAALRDRRRARPARHLHRAGRGGAGPAVVRLPAVRRDPARHRGEDPARPAAGRAARRRHRRDALGAPAAQVHAGDRRLPRPEDVREGERRAGGDAASRSW